MQNLGDLLQLKNLFPIASVTTSGNGTGIDLQPISGEIAALLDVSAPVAGTLPTLACKLQESDDNSTNWTDVVGGGFSAVAAAAVVEKLSLNKNEMKRYVRFVRTIGGTDSPQYLVSAKIVGIDKYPA